MKLFYKGLILSLVMILCLNTVFFAASDIESRFSDFPNDDSREALISAVENGLLVGFGGKIMPDKELTRAQMAAIIVSAFGATQTTDLAKYNDVTPKDWYFDKLAKAVHMKIIVGSEGQLKPNAFITREMAFAVLVSAFKLPAGNMKSIQGFEDYSSISTWARPAVAAMVEAGYITGSNNKLMPKDVMTRAQFAVVMHQMVQVYIVDDKVYTGEIKGNVLIRTHKAVFKDCVIKGDVIIAEGVKSGLDLSGLIATGRIVVRSSEVAFDLGLEDIALGAGNKPVVTVPSVPSVPVAPPSTPVTSPTTPEVPVVPPVEAQTLEKLNSVKLKLTSRVVPQLTTPLQHEAVDRVTQSIQSFINNTSYDIAADVEGVKKIREKMSETEYLAMKNAITSNIPLSELVELNKYFNLIAY